MSTKDDLLAFLDELAERKPKPKALTKAEKRRRQKAQAAESFAKLKEELHQACEAMNLWQPIAKVNILYASKCNHCGNVSLIPELHISEKPLVKFRHQRTKAEKFCREEPRNLPCNLPTILKQLPAESTFCLECLDTHEPSHEVIPGYPEPKQLRLF